MGNVNLSDNVTDRCRSLVQWGMLTFQTMLQIDVEVWYNGEC